MATAVKKPAHPLSHLIPDFDQFASGYISRIIEGVQDLAVLRYAKEARVNTMIFGPTGPGKTSCILAYCATDRIPLVTIQCHGAVDPATFWGGLFLDPATNTYVWQDSEVTLIIKNGGFLYLDEVNFLHPKIAASLQSLTDKRRQITIMEKGNEVIEAHPNLQIGCTFNPEYEGTRPLNPAFKNRFVMKLEFDYDPKVEAELLCLPVMQELATKLRASHKEGDIDTPVSTNMLIEFEVLAVDITYEFAVMNFLNAFSADERPSVKESFTLYGDRINEQLVQVKAMATEDA